MTLATQKVGLGRSPTLHTAMTAVPIGSSPLATPLAATPTRGSASAVSIPKPKPTQQATMTRLARSSRLGRGARPSRRHTTATAAARTDRPAPTTRGAKPSNATRIAGNVSENARTPRAAHLVPTGTRRLPPSTASVEGAVALS